MVFGNDKQSFIGVWITPKVYPIRWAIRSMELCRNLVDGTLDTYILEFPFVQEMQELDRD